MFFSSNVEYLRKQMGFKQSEIADGTGIERTTWSNYERGKSYPKLEDFVKIAKYFGVKETDLLHGDLKNAHLIKKVPDQKKPENAHPNAHPNAHLNDKKADYSGEIKLTIAADPDVKYARKHTAIPITDIAVAAGAGIFNNDYIEHTDHLSVPARMTKKGAIHLAILVKGPSMAPTLQDGSYVIIRLLDRSEWLEMPDKRVYVVCDMEGKGVIKRVKNRFKQDFIVLTSDSPDKASFPNYNMHTDEVHHIWEAVAKVDFKMANIHDQYYTKLEQIEDRLELLEQKLIKN